MGMIFQCTLTPPDSKHGQTGTVETDLFWLVLSPFQQEQKGLEESDSDRVFYAGQ